MIVEQPMAFPGSATNTACLPCRISVSSSKKLGISNYYVLVAFTIYPDKKKYIRIPDLQMTFLHQLYCTLYLMDQDSVKWKWDNNVLERKPNRVSKVVLPNINLVFKHINYISYSGINMVCRKHLHLTQTVDIWDRATLFSCLVQIIETYKVQNIVVVMHCFKNQNAWI